MPPRSITDAQVAQAEALKGKMPVRAIADEVGISAANVCYIHQGRFRQEFNRELELAPGERRVDPLRCSKCGALNVVVPCRTCRTEAKVAMKRSGPPEHCTRCKCVQPTHHNARQVRCAKCGNFIRRRTEAEHEADRAAEPRISV